MEFANTRTIKVHGRELTVLLDQDSKKVEGIWIKGGRDPTQLFNPLCDDEPWCYNGGNGLPEDNDRIGRMSIRDSIFEKVREVVGDDVTFPIKPNAQPW